MPRNITEKIKCRLGIEFGFNDAQVIKTFDLFSSIIKKNPMWPTVN